MSEVGRPPRLRIRHQSRQILDHGVEVERLKLLGVVEILTHRVGQVGVAMEHLDIQRVRPPIAVSVSAGEWAFARALVVCFCVHVFLRWVGVSGSVYKDYPPLKSDPGTTTAGRKRLAFTECLITGSAPT